MIQIDEALLQELGLAALPPDDKQNLYKHIYQTLQIRAGAKLAGDMSDAQLAEFEQFTKDNDADGAMAWLQANFPNYQDVLDAEFEQLKTEIREIVPQLLDAASK